MFDVGFSEIMLISVIALIVVGPERLPKLARTAGLWIGKARSLVTSVKVEVERELRVSELKKSIQEQTKAPSEELKKLADQVKTINNDVGALDQELKKTVDGTSSSPSAPAATTPDTSPVKSPPAADSVSAVSSSAPADSKLTNS